MTEEEMDRLDEQLARKFGWFHPVDSTGAEYESLWVSCQDKDDGAIPVGEEQVIIPTFMWKPTRYSYQAVGNGQRKTVVGEMHRLGFNFNLNWQGHPGVYVSIAQFHKIAPFVHGQGFVDVRETQYVISLPVCLAAAEVLGIYLPASVRRAK